MKEGLLSIIIISYENSSLVLKRAIQSVKEQKYSNYEIILVDANEEKSAYSLGLREDIEKQPDISLVSCPSKQGEFALAKNKGAEAAKGEYIAYLKASDAWNSECTEKQIKVLQEKKETGLVFCHSWSQEEDAFSTEYRNPPVEVSKEKEKREEDFLYQESICSISQVMFRSEVFYEMRGFDINMKGQDEYDLWLRIASKYRIMGIEENLVCSYVEKDTLKKTHKLLDVIGYLQLYSKHKEMYDKNPVSKVILYKKIAACYKDSYYYLQWMQYILKIKILERKIIKNKTDGKVPTV